MTDFYCDHGAYGLTTNRIGLDAPTWGVPQEGDGTSKDAATASSVASVDLTSITSTAGTFSLFGSAAISVGASASGATLATQIANAINTSSTPTGNTSIFPGAPQLRNAFFARATGATLEIMCRIGSALTNVLGMTWAGTWSAGPPGNLTFSGGSGGCWGWFINPVALGVGGSIGLRTYGTWLYAPYITTVANSAKNRIWQRTGGGASKAITLAFAASLSYSASGNRLHIFDTNTVWTGDIATGAVALTITHEVWNGSFGINLAVGGAHCSLIALAPYGFTIDYSSTQSSSFDLSITGNGSTLTCENIRVTNTSGNVAAVLTVFSFGSMTGGALRYKNCLISRTNAFSTIPAISLTSYNGVSVDLIFEGCTFNYPVSGASDPGPLLTMYSGYNTVSTARFANCAFIGWTSEFSPYSGAIQRSDFINMEFENCTGVAIPTALYGLPVTYQVMRTIQRLFISKPNGDFRLEDKRGATDWQSGKGYPYLSGILYGSNVPWTLRVLLVNLAYFAGSPTSTPTIRQNHQQATGAAQLSVELFVPTALVFYQGTVSCTFCYVDDTGVMRSESSSLLVSSAATWANASSFPLYSAKKIVVTTEYPVQTQTEVNAIVYFSESPSSGQNEYVYVDPVIGVA